MWVRAGTNLTEDPLSDTGSPTRMYTDPMCSGQVTLTETAGAVGSPPGPWAVRVPFPGAHRRDKREGLMVWREAGALWASQGRHWRERSRMARKPVTFATGVRIATQPPGQGSEMGDGDSRGCAGDGRPGDGDGAVVADVSGDGARGLESGVATVRLAKCACGSWGSGQAWPHLGGRGLTHGGVVSEGTCPAAVRT